MRLSALFDEFCQYLRVEKEAAPRSIQTYRWCFGDFLEFARKEVGPPVLVNQFTAELCRAYQYDLSARGLQTNTIRVRLATLGSFGRWALRRGKVLQNPLDFLTRPRRKARLPRVPRWEGVEQLLRLVRRLAGARDCRPGGLRRVRGKGGQEAAVPLPEVARAIINEYLAQERAGVASDQPLFVVRYRTNGAQSREQRISGQRVWKIIKALGRRAGVPELHPHAFRHSCGAELLRRTGGNLRAVQAHLRHADIQTTTLYTRLTQDELQKVVSVFDATRN